MPVKTTRYKTEEVKTGSSFIACGATWFIYAMIFPLYRISDFVIAAVLSAVVFIVVDRLAPKKTLKIALDDEPLVTGVPSADEILKLGQEFIDEINNANVKIKDVEISAKITRITAILDKILEQLRKDPQEADELKTFMNYYLPTITKLLDYYDNFEKQGLAGTNISSSMAKISALLDTAADAFAKAFDSMFADEALDITTDIAAMENMLATKGLKKDINDIEIKEKV